MGGRKTAIKNNFFLNPKTMAQLTHVSCSSNGTKSNYYNIHSHQPFETASNAIIILIHEIELLLCHKRIHGFGE